MKKTFIILAIAVTGLSSCGGDSGLKSMIYEGTKLECEKNELKKKLREGDSSVADRYDQVKIQLDAVGDKMREKYKGKKNDKDFMKKVMKYGMEAKMKYCPEK